MKTQLCPHQQQTVERIYKSGDSGADLSDPGTGKTLSALAGLVEIGKPAVVIAPKTLVEPAWLGDIEAHTDPGEFTPFVALAPQSRRDKALEGWRQAWKRDNTVPLLITNHDAAGWLLEQGVDTPVTVIDESTAYANMSAKRSKAIRKMKRGRTFILTGSAFSRSVEQIWHQMYLVDGGERLGSTLGSFRFRFCVPQRIPGINIIRWVDRPEAPEQVAELIADISIRHRLDQVLPSLPPNHRVWRWYALPPKAMKAYRKLARDYVLEVQGKEISAANAVTLLQKLGQLAAGVMYAMDGSKVLMDPTRSQLAIESAEEGLPAVVFYNWRHQLEQLEQEADRKKLKHGAITGDTPVAERSRLVKAFQAGELDILFLHYLTGAHGLTLTRGRTVVMTAPPVGRPDLVQQGIARIVRRGQAQETRTVVVAARGTVDERYWQALGRGETVMKVFLNVMEELTNG